MAITVNALYSKVNTSINYDNASNHFLSEKNVM